MSYGNVKMINVPLTYIETERRIIIALGQEGNGMAVHCREMGNENLELLLVFPFLIRIEKNNLLHTKC